MLRITDEGVHPAKGQRHLKTSRMGTGRRTIPIPVKLLELGFLDYVEWLKGKGLVALFPALRPKGRRGTLHDGFAQWWREYLGEKIGLASGAGRKASREFRHNFTTAARRSGLTEAGTSFIQGHGSPGQSAHGLYGSRSPLGFEIDWLEFRGLDLSKVKPWKAPPVA